MGTVACYQLDQLGWLQFERLCGLVLESGEPTPRLSWHGRADEARVAWLEEPLELPGHGRVGAPASIAIVWVPDRQSQRERLIELATRVSTLTEERGSRSDARIVVLTNLDGARARRTLAALEVGPSRRTVVLGVAELGALLDGDARLRAALPSVLGLRDLAPLIAPDLRARSRFDLAGGQALARVFSPTRAFERARLVLERHRFVVLTGPPEMGKTAIARMIALAALTDGWEVHECDEPQALWRAFERGRRQLFIADDAFGSTEYRPDAGERWAREIAGLLAVLDERHALIWTSRPAPLKAGLRRVQRERGSERFPAPGEVLVDASDLDLEEKTLILFRHAKARGAAEASRMLLRSAGLAIVEHPHFTPERIRRFVAGRLEELPDPARIARAELLRILELELASPTHAMRASFAALEREHRDLLIALLDAPAGLIDERELATAVRRHHPGGLSHHPAELIDRLTDHFLRVTSLGVGWVHPSWRDLVIEQLRAHDDERVHFLRSCGLHGAMLALSREGSASGERALPLLVSDGDWDALGDRVAVLLRELDDHDVARLLVALRESVRSDAAAAVEARCLAEFALQATRRAWEHRRAPLPLPLLEAWYSLSARVADPPPGPQVQPTWFDLYPDPALVLAERAELARADEWLALAQLLARNDPAALARLGFPERDERLLKRLIRAAGALVGAGEDGVRELAGSIVARIREVAPGQAGPLALALAEPDATVSRRWWVPEDIAYPPTQDPVAAPVGEFTRADVARVLRDL